MKKISEGEGVSRKKWALIIIIIALLVIGIAILAAIFVPKDVEVASNDPVFEPSVATESSVSENINGLNVKWDSNASETQKKEIRDLLDNMVEVEGGSFKMGTHWKNALDDERPVHEENVATFRMEKHEVPQRLWVAVIGYNPSDFKGDNLPVENVNYKSVEEFIDSLNILTGLKFRLPTEAEWEYAAGGGKYQHAYVYSGSDNAEDVAWYNATSKASTHEVGTKKPNALGLYDMSGNVWELTSDKASEHYDHPREGSYYIKRGGSWDHDAWNSRVTRRDRVHPTTNDGTIGFRLAL